MCVYRRAFQLIYIYAIENVHVDCRFSRLGGGVIFVFSWSVVYDDTLEYVRVIKSMKTR